MKKITVICLTLLFLLTACAGAEQFDLPKPPEDGSAVGTYLFDYAYYREGFDGSSAADQGTTGAERILPENMRQKALSGTGDQWRAIAYVFSESGTFTKIQYYTGEIQEAGCYTYDGTALKLYTMDGEPYFGGRTFTLKTGRILMDLDEESGISCAFLLQSAAEPAA